MKIIGGGGFPLYSISLAIPTAAAILNSLEVATTNNQPEHEDHYLGGRESVHFLAVDILIILGDAMILATTMLPQKLTSMGKGQMLPHHLWPKSVKHEVFIIRRRTKALRRLAVEMASAPEMEAADPSDMESPHYHL